jgi:uncharacterized integral membrane protein
MTIILVIIIAGAVTLFSVQNAMPVSISFLLWQFDASLAIIALLFFLAGMVTGAGMLFWVRMRKRAKKKRRESEAAAGQKSGFEQKVL